MLTPRARYGAEAAAAAGLLIHGDNLAAMHALLRDGVSVDLAIIDPPFATGDAFSFALPIGEGDEIHRAPAYSDRWPGGIGGFLAMLDPRLRLLHRLLASDGSLYVHLDPTVAHPVKILLDEIFGPGCFQREIIWRIGWISGFKSRVHNWVRNHDTILFYVKDPRRFTFNKRYIPYPPGYRRRDGKAPRGPGIPIDDVWNAGPGDLELRGADSLDSIQIRSFSREKTGWATQKNESLLRRIIEASSKPGDRIVDVFCGAGTTLAAAAALGRRWIGCDRAAMAIHLARKRLREADVAFVLAEVSEVSAEVSEVSPAPVLRVDAEAGRLEAEWVGACGFAELHAAAAEARARGLGRLMLLADRWGFALEAATAREERRAAALRGLEITCLYRRQALPEEPALPRPALELHGESAGPWGFFLEIGGYRPHCTASLPDPTLAARIHRWDEWLDGWALALGDTGPFAPCVERYRSRRQRALPCRTAEPVVIPAGERRGQVHGVLEVVDILGLATRWPLTLSFDGDGRLLGVALGIERLAEASGLA